MDLQNTSKTNKEASSSKGPILSVVIATLETWPTIKGYLKPLLSQAEALGIEIIIAGGNGQALADDSHPNLIWVREIGSSVYRLRALGVRRARGEIIAFTEDHCKVSPDWCERIIKAHQEHPDVAVISGVIENGSTDSLLDWVHFLMAKGPFMSPITPGESHLISGEPNISFKKHIVSNCTSDIGFSFYQGIHKQGHRTRMQEDLIVWHIQSLGLRGTCEIHFHNGKTIAGFRLPHLSRSMRMLRIASCIILPGFLTARTFGTVLRKRRQRLTLLLGLPLLVLLAICHSIGELFGYLVGPGSSPHMMN